MSASMWFDEGVQHALDKCKKDKLILMVLVKDDGEESSKLLSLFEDANVKSLVTDAMTAIKLTQGTNDAKMFADIYPVVSLPCVYFISNDGVPLEVVIGSVDADGLVSRIIKAIELHITKGSSDDKVSTNAEAAANAETDTLQDDNNVSKDEKIALTKQKMEELRIKREKEEEERERVQELERIRTGKELAKAQKLKEEVEIKNLIAQRERERLEDKMAKERVLAQIRADKEDRLAREAAIRGEVVDKPQATGYKPAPAVQSNCNETRIQFKFSDGKTLVQTFPAEESLDKVRSFLKDKNNLADFKLAVPFPRKTFTDSDNDKNMKELDLVPSSVLLVINPVYQHCQDY